MVRKFRSLLAENPAVFKNFVALGVLQGTNFLIPLIIMPYLIHTIGVELYGVIGFVQAVMIYFFSFTDYGFSITATQEISVAKKNTKKLNDIFNVVLATKVILLLVSAIIICCLIVLIGDFSNQKTAFLFGFMLVLGQATLPTWFFQGVEKMKFITYINLGAKILFTILIFLFIQEKEDYPYVLFFFGIGNLVSGAVGLRYAVKQYGFKLKWPKFQEIKLELKKGWGLFLANISISSYMNSNIFILGFFTTDLILGYYVIAEKIIMAVRQILVVFSQAIFPQACQKAEEGYSKLINFYRPIFIPFAILIAIICGGIYLFSKEIISIFSSEGVAEISILLMLMSFIPAIVCLNIPVSHILLAYKKRRPYTTIMVSASILNIILNVFLAQILDAKGTVYSVIITEGYITVGLYLFLKLKLSDELLSK